MDMRAIFYCPRERTLFPNSGSGIIPTGFPADLNDAFDAQAFIKYRIIADRRMKLPTPASMAGNIIGTNVDSSLEFVHRHTVNHKHKPDKVFLDQGALPNMSDLDINVYGLAVCLYFRAQYGTNFPNPGVQIAYFNSTGAMHWFDD